MDVKEALFVRRSIRSFTEEAVREEEIQSLLHAAMSGPSAVNRCPWEFYVVTAKGKIAELNKVGYAKYPSPLMVVIAGNSRRFLPLEAKNYWIEDVSASAENILLEATELGLGACWCGVYPGKRREKQVRAILSLPLHIVPFAIVIIGHPKGEIPAPRDQYNEAKIHRVD